MPPIEGMTTEPYGVAEYPEIHGGIWYGCLLWAAREPEVVAAFEADSGLSLTAVLNAGGMDKMIDDATGRAKATIVAFADFVTRNYWGEEGDAR